VEHCKPAEFIKANSHLEADLPRLSPAPFRATVGPEEHDPKAARRADQSCRAGRARATVAQADRALAAANQAGRAPAAARSQAGRVQVAADRTGRWSLAGRVLAAEDRVGRWVPAEGQGDRRHGVAVQGADGAVPASNLK
jgi:hypothetical protein